MEQETSNKTTGKEVEMVLRHLKKIPSTSLKNGYLSVLLSKKGLLPKETVRALHEVRGDLDSRMRPYNHIGSETVVEDYRSAGRIDKIDSYIGKPHTVPRVIQKIFALKPIMAIYSEGIQHYVDYVEYPKRFENMTFSDFEFKLMGEDLERILKITNFSLPDGINYRTDKEIFYSDESTGARVSRIFDRDIMGLIRVMDVRKADIERILGMSNIFDVLKNFCEIAIPMQTEFVKKVAEGYQSDREGIYMINGEYTFLHDDYEPGKTAHNLRIVAERVTGRITKLRRLAGYFGINVNDELLSRLENKLRDDIEKYVPLAKRYTDK